MPEKQGVEPIYDIPREMTDDTGDGDDVPRYLYPELYVTTVGGKPQQVESGSVADLTDKGIMFALGLGMPPGYTLVDAGTQVLGPGIGYRMGRTSTKQNAEKWAERLAYMAFVKAATSVKAAGEGAKAAKGKGDVKDILTDYAKALKFSMEVTSELGAQQGREYLRGNT